MADNNAFEQWQADGSEDAATRANKLWKQALKDYQEPEIDPAVLEGLDQFLADRKSQMEDRWY